MFGSKINKVKKAVEKKREKPILELTGDKDKQVRLAAIAGLSNFNTDDCFNALVPFLHNIDADIRAAAATALGNMGNAHAKAHISFQIKNETDAKARDAMIAALSQIKGE